KPSGSPWPGQDQPRRAASDLGRPQAGSQRVARAGRAGRAAYRAAVVAAAGGLREDIREAKTRSVGPCGNCSGAQSKCGERAIKGGFRRTLAGTEGTFRGVVAWIDGGDASTPSLSVLRQYGRKSGVPASTC